MLLPGVDEGYCPLVRNYHDVLRSVAVEGMIGVSGVSGSCGPPMQLCRCFFVQCSLVYLADLSLAIFRQSLVALHIFVMTNCRPSAEDLHQYLQLSVNYKPIRVPVRVNITYEYSYCTVPASQTRAPAVWSA